MGSVYRIVFLLLRGAQLASACVVAGILGHLLAQVDNANGPVNGRVAYGEVTAAVSIVASICLMYPFRVSFWLSFLDILLFIVSAAGQLKML